VPVRKDVTPAPGIHPLGTLKGISKDPQEMHEKLPDLIERWRDTFGVWNKARNQRGICPSRRQADVAKRHEALHIWAARGCSSMVEQQPSKLNTRVRFPSPAPKILDACHRRLFGNPDRFVFAVRVSSFR
jgi:hypothetical protein